MIIIGFELDFDAHEEPHRPGSLLGLLHAFRGHCGEAGPALQGPSICRGEGQAQVPVRCRDAHGSKPRMRHASHLTLVLSMHLKRSDSKGV